MAARRRHGFESAAVEAAGMVSSESTGGTGRSTPPRLVRAVVSCTPSIRPTPEQAAKTSAWTVKAIGTLSTAAVTPTAHARPVAACPANNEATATPAQTNNSVRSEKRGKSMAKRRR
jgi:hypothetical protein